MRNSVLRGSLILGDHTLAQGLVGSKAKLILLEDEEDEEQASDDHTRDADIP
jgi:hypothetical protein